MMKFVKQKRAIIRDGQYRDTCIGDTYRAILLYRYRYRLSVTTASRIGIDEACFCAPPIQVSRY